MAEEQVITKDVIKNELLKILNHNGPDGDHDRDRDQVQLLNYLRAIRDTLFRKNESYDVILNGIVEARKTYNTSPNEEIKKHLLESCAYWYEKYVADLPNRFTESNTWYGKNSLATEKTKFKLALLELRTTLAPYSTHLIANLAHTFAQQLEADVANANVQDSKTTNQIFTDCTVSLNTLNNAFKNYYSQPSNKRKFQEISIAPFKNSLTKLQSISSGKPGSSLISNRTKSIGLLLLGGLILAGSIYVTAQTGLLSSPLTIGSTVLGVKYIAAGLIGAGIVTTSTTIFGIKFWRDHNKETNGEAQNKAHSTGVELHSKMAAGAA